MTFLPDLIGDAQAIGAMSEAEFRTYWEALGTVVRIAARAARPPEPEAPEPPGRDPTGTTSATVELCAQWDHDKRPPVRAFGLGR